MLKILDYIHDHPGTWEKDLLEEPYCIATVWDGDYCLLKYSHLASDFSIPMVRECRGLILYKDTERVFSPVCVPFFKFSNYGESYAADLDWRSARVMEKVDGSLIKVWFHMGKWHVSTNNTIDAKTAILWNNKSFYDLFLEAVRKVTIDDTFFKTLDTNYTYMFELVSPDSQVVIHYPSTEIYYLTCRNNESLEEDWAKGAAEMAGVGVRIPKIYPLTSLEECIAATTAMTKDEEGFVACDAHGNRVKIKSQEYINAHIARNNNIITTKRILQMIRAGTLDDFLAYAPDFEPQVEKVLDAYISLQIHLDTKWQIISSIPDIKNMSKAKFYSRIKDYSPVTRDFLCQKFDKKCDSALKYLDNLRFSILLKIIKERLGEI